MNIDICKKCGNASNTGSFCLIDKNDPVYIHTNDDIPNKCIYAVEQLFMPEPDEKEERLKDCPFCHNDADYIQKDVDKYDVRCVNMDCYLCNGANWSLSKKVITKIWNGRIE